MNITPLIQGLEGLGEEETQEREQKLTFLFSLSLFK